MFTFVLAQRLGLQSDWITTIAIGEGILLTVVLMLLAERYLFSPPAQDSALRRVPAPASNGTASRADQGTAAGSAAQA